MLAICLVPSESHSSLQGVAQYIHGHRDRILSRPLTLDRIPISVRRAVVALALIACFFSLRLSAHELPERVLVRVLAAAELPVLDVMLRVPLEALRDVDFPLTPEGYLELADTAPTLNHAATLWVVGNLRFRVGDQFLAPTEPQLRIALPGDRAFASLDSARRHFASPPLPPDTMIFWRQAMLDIRLRYPLPAALEPGELVMDAELRSLGVQTRVEMRFIAPSGEDHALAFAGDVKGLNLMPSFWGVAGDFLRQGFVHILGGIDHLLFLVCLILPLRRAWPLVKTVTAFTLAHSITLGASALGWVPTSLWFASLVEAVIALSIVYLALENVLRAQFSARWKIAFLFGLVHGFGFASALSESLQFAQGELLAALAAFNIGVELGQLLILTVLLPTVAFVFRRIDNERIAIIVLSTLVAHTGWHWMMERVDALRGYFF